MICDGGLTLQFTVVLIHPSCSTNGKLSMQQMETSSVQPCGNDILSDNHANVEGA